MICPVHKEEMHLVSASIIMRNTAEVAHRSHEVFLSAQYGINTAIQTVCEEGSKFYYQCPYGCEFNTTQTSETVVEKRWEKTHRRNL